MPNPTHPHIRPDYAPARGILQGGGVVVLPTDTVYGIVASALIPETVERVFQLRQRDTHKAVIVLISNEGELKRFSIPLDEQAGTFLRSVWPGRVSVVLPTTEPARWTHLHRGTDSIAFRIPADPALRAFLRRTGPLIAPSANTAGEPAATSIDTARKYFDDRVDLYIDGGTLESAPSTLVRWTPGGIEILRQGAVQIDESLI
ncbi:MAG: threonylcarbamoyl-AMP synthase [Candidatus Moraniibacteriota bacterium]|nr:MAG: threonylcarbamoyl-AMP synthase [Candidatus Moranbacteria bacterium]